MKKILFIFLVIFFPCKTVAAGKEKISGMVFIPSGKFIFGTNERFEDEGPEQSVYLDGYYLDIYEVTNEDYKKFVDSTGRQPPQHWRGKPPSSDKLKHPVVYVSWFDAYDYCRWAGKHLPAQEEWEKGARGSDGRRFPWGNEFDQTKSNNPQKNSKGTEAVGSYENGKSIYGLYDMSGNVWEWVDSWYLPYPGAKPDPKYGKNKRTLKGGSWFNCMSYGCGISAPVYNRSYFVPTVKNNSFGFRCAK